MDPGVNNVRMKASQVTSISCRADYLFFNEIRVMNFVCLLDASVYPDLCRHFASSVTSFSSLKATVDQMQTMSDEHMILNNERNV